MTYEEANKVENIIKSLNRRRMCPCGYCKKDKCVPVPEMAECKEQDFVINKSIEALEKQIPKKPIDKDTLTFGRCPICKSALSNMKYCYNCGQALDWENT